MNHLIEINITSQHKPIPIPIKWKNPPLMYCCWVAKKIIEKTNPIAHIENVPKPI